MCWQILYGPKYVIFLWGLKTKFVIFIGIKNSFNP